MSLSLVLLPGLDGTGVLFEPLIEELPPEMIPHIIPLPKDSALGYEELVPFVNSALPRNGPFILLGESFSGPLALMVAAFRPPGLLGVILCASFIRNPTYFPSWVRHLCGSWLFSFSPAFVQAKALLGGYSVPRLRGLLARAHSSVPAHVIAHRVRAVLTVDATRELSSCPVPVAYLRGTRDKVVPKRNLRQAIAANPGLIVFAVPAPHLVLQTQPRRAAEAIAAFAKNIGAA